MDIGGGKLSLKGTVGADMETTAIALDTRYSHPDIVALIRSLSPGYTPSKRDLGPATLVSRLEGTTANLEINGLRLGLGPVSLSGKASLAFTDPRPKLTLAAESGTIAIDPWLPGETAVPSGGVAPVVPVKSSSRTWSRETIDISGLRAIDADIALEAAQVLYGTYKLDTVVLAATLNNGTHYIAAILCLFGGTLDGTASQAWRNAHRRSDALHQKCGCARSGHIDFRCDTSDGNAELRDQPQHCGPQRI